MNVLQTAVILLGAVSTSVAAVGPPTVEQHTAGYCSPTIANAGNVTNICNLSEEELRLNAKHNWDVARASARAVREAKTLYLFPAIDAYERSPSPQTWTEVKHEVGLVRSMLDVAMRSALQYEATRPQNGPSPLSYIHQIYETKSSELGVLEVKQAPMRPDELRDWLRKYQHVVGQLERELEHFDSTTLSQTTRR
jgi:hypothetical protein